MSFGNPFANLAASANGISPSAAMDALMKHMPAEWFTAYRQPNYWNNPDLWVGITAGSTAGDPGVGEGYVKWERSADGDTMAEHDFFTTFDVLVTLYRLKPLKQAEAAAGVAIAADAAAAAIKAEVDAANAVKKKVASDAAAMASAKAQNALNMKKSTALSQEKSAKKFAIAATIASGLAIAYKLSKKK